MSVITYYMLGFKLNDVSKRGPSDGEWYKISILNVDADWFAMQPPADQEMCYKILLVGLDFNMDFS